MKKTLWNWSHVCISMNWNWISCIVELQMIFTTFTQVGGYLYSKLQHMKLFGNTLFLAWKLQTTTNMLVQKYLHLISTPLFSIPRLKHLKRKCAFRNSNMPRPISELFQMEFLRMSFNGSALQCCCKPRYRFYCFG